jgi:hypothetical protein
MHPDLLVLRLRLESCDCVKHFFLPVIEGGRAAISANHLKRLRLLDHHWTYIGLEGGS